MTKNTMIVPANADQQNTINQMTAQGYVLQKDTAVFDVKLGTVPVMKSATETIYILPNGETCSEEEWHTVEQGLMAL